ncbi:MAG TPA: bi-domain-containing oxidoreductase [Bacteroidia bacterium]|nr:bi-domain-containing oxidoreductase [Bacteroidia bacterium]
MEQLTQSLKDGKMEILEVPFPALNAGQVLVRNHYSLISAGTEGKTVKDARLGYLGKARARKDEVKKVIQSARTLGVFETYRLVMNKLDAPSALGYSCAGEIIAVADDVRDFKIGDKVACGGAGAVHAEVVAIPVNLCVKIDDTVSLSHAAFTTVGSIAMQGVRQADLRLGENCVVIGLGLVGQLTVQLLNASGIKTVGIDIDKAQCNLAIASGAELSFQRNEEQLEQAILNFTNGYGADAVIITAGTSSNDPIDLAGVLCRRKGKVIIVGAVPTGFSRKNYYNKELELRMSCSYGPGRYDSEYEEKGIDYPQAYVRWTENRNMQAFAELLRLKKINPEKLLTHTFNFQEAKNAYQLIVDRTEPFVGIVLKYDTAKALSDKVFTKHVSTPISEVKLGMIGAGSFGQNFLLPALKGKVNFVGVATARPNNARNVADKYGFEFCTGNADEVISNEKVNTLFIATRHNTHGEYVLKGLKANKNVFVEKPLCMSIDELLAIKEAKSKTNAQVMVGFNRRFAPLITKLKASLNNSIPSAILYRINAGIMPPDHWIHDPEVGGGRIIGEVCHFIDLCSFLCSSPIEHVSAQAMKDAHHNNDSVAINLGFKNGSIATISYFSNGNKEFAKEYIEVFNGGLIAKIEDFTTLSVYGKNKNITKSNQDKGHKNEVTEFISALSKGKELPISFDEIYNSTFATFAVLDSISNNGQKIVLPE